MMQTFFSCSSTYTPTHTLPSLQPTQLQPGIDSGCFFEEGDASPLSYQWIGKNGAAFILNFFYLILVSSLYFWVFMGQAILR